MGCGGKPLALKYKSTETETQIVGKDFGKGSVNVGPPDRMRPGSPIVGAFSWHSETLWGFIGSSSQQGVAVGCNLFTSSEKKFSQSLKLYLVQLICSLVVSAPGNKLNILKVIFSSTNTITYVTEKQYNLRENKLGGTLKMRKIKI